MIDIYNSCDIKVELNRYIKRATDILLEEGLQKQSSLYNITKINWHIAALVTHTIPWKIKLSTANSKNTFS